MRGLERFSLDFVPVKLLVANTLLTAVYSVGFVAATYASVLNPGMARTALLLSAIVNGAGMIAMAFVVDPTSARIVDRALKGERSIHDVRSMVFWLAITTVAGTLLAQALLVPASALISAAANVVGR